MARIPDLFTTLLPTIRQKLNRSSWKILSLSKRAHRLHSALQRSTFILTAKSKSTLTAEGDKTSTRVVSVSQMRSVRGREGVK
jgi:hypothetical protein